MTMMAYLESGWFEDGGSERLCEPVLDGAVDIAGSLYRGGVTPDEVQSLRFTPARSSHYSTQECGALR